MQYPRHSHTYEQRLRSIGARLDSGGYHSVSIIESEGGLLVRANAPGARTPEVLELPDADGIYAAQLAPMRNGVPHRLFPDGYKGFLAALGRLLDRSQAAAIAIVEGTDFVTVGGIQPVEADGAGITFEPLDVLLLADDVRALIAQADALLEQERREAELAETPPEIANPSVVDTLLHRVSAAVDSALRMITPTQNTARTRG